MLLPTPVNTCVCTNVGVCTFTHRCSYRMCVHLCVYRAQVDACRCAHACVNARTVTSIQDWRLPPSDLTQPWTLLLLRSIRIIYPTLSLPSRLMHRGVKHLVMLNHSGAQHARSHPEWQHTAREAGWGKKCHITLRERKRGRWRRREKSDGLDWFGCWGRGGRDYGYKRGLRWLESTSTYKRFIWKCCCFC